MGKIIEIHNVFKSYDKKKVLENVSFSIEEGKFSTLIGCNGAGKSTTLRLLAGVDHDDNGEIKVLGSDPFDISFKHRSDVFFIHENFTLKFPMNLLEMVKIYRSVFPRWNNKIFNQILKARKFGIKKNFADLSRGQKMQFLLMIGLAARPKVLLLDEITSVIDIEGQRFFLELLKQYTEEGGTVVITTNILSELNDYTDHLILLQETKVLVDSPVDELQKKFYLFKKTEEHAIFKNPESAKVRKDNDGKELYLVPRDVADKNPEALKFKMDYIPRLEDILILHFQMKKEATDEELVA